MLAEHYITLCSRKGTETKSKRLGSGAWTSRKTVPHAQMNRDGIAISRQGLVRHEATPVTFEHVVSTEPLAEMPPGFITSVL